MDIERILSENQTAVDELIATAEAASNHWTTLPAPGKWSPSQVVEHVALTLEQSSYLVEERANELPSMPAIVRPMMRMLFFKRILKKRTFPKIKTAPFLSPERGPNTPEQAKDRLTAALAMFEKAIRGRKDSGKPVRSGAFGEVSVEDYATFQEIHTRHHCGQISAA